MSSYKMVLSTNQSTVVTEYEPQTKRSDAYQSEAALESAFIKMLTEQGYEYITIHDEVALIQNLRTQLERLNRFSFTDKEWDRFFKDKIADQNEGIVEKTRKIQEDYVQNLIREDGTTMNISLIDKKNIHNNRLQVINQYEVGQADGAKYDNRYDVTILVNGLPMVHVELKRRGVALKEAFNQINRYQRDSFWADANNRTIPDLVNFTKTFFAKHALLNILTRYCVFTSEKLLLVMRPYQIVATERILNRIEVSTNYKKTGTLAAGPWESITTPTT